MREQDQDFAYDPYDDIADDYIEDEGVDDTEDVIDIADYDFGMHTDDTDDEDPDYSFISREESRARLRSEEKAEVESLIKEKKQEYRKKYEKNLRLIFELQDVAEELLQVDDGLLIFSPRDIESTNQDMLRELKRQQEDALKENMYITKQLERFDDNEAIGDDAIVIPREHYRELLGRLRELMNQKRIRRAVTEEIKSVYDELGSYGR